MVNHSATKKSENIIVTIQNVSLIRRWAWIVVSIFDSTEGEGQPGRDKAKRAVSSSGKTSSEDIFAEKINNTLLFLEKQNMNQQRKLVAEK